jgi:hypothetical protein
MTRPRLRVATACALALLAMGCRDASSSDAPRADPPSHDVSTSPTADGEHPGPGQRPAFFPEVDRRLDVGDPLHYRLAGMPGTATLRGHVSDGGVGAGDAELVVRIHMFTFRAPIPAGWPPQLVGHLALPRKLDGFVVSQEGGDSDTWTVYRSLEGDLKRVPVSHAAPFGGGFTRDGIHAYRTWMTRRGGLFTRVGLGGARERVWRWGLHGTSLVPTDLGVYCFDESHAPVSYRPC